MRCELSANSKPLRKPPESNGWTSVRTVAQCSPHMKRELKAEEYDEIVSTIAAGDRIKATNIYLSATEGSLTDAPRHPSSAAANRQEQSTNPRARAWNGSWSATGATPSFAHCLPRYSQRQAVSRSQAGFQARFYNTASMSARSPSDRRSWINASESRPECLRRNPHWL